jgi:hypothetical protein
MLNDPGGVAAGNIWVITVEGTILNGANAGTVQVQINSGDNTNSITVYKGSTLDYQRLA